MTAGEWLGVVFAGYVLVGVVWGSVVSWLGRDDSVSDGEQVLVFAGLVVLWPVAAVVVIPDVVKRGVGWCGRELGRSRSDER